MENKKGRSFKKIIFLTNFIYHAYNDVNWSRTTALTGRSKNKRNEQKATGWWEVHGKLITNTSPSFTPNLHDRSFCGDAIVGCDVAAHVTSAWVLSDTRRGRPCEWSVNKGGNTSLYPRPFWRTGVFLCGSKGPAPSGCCTAARKRQPQIQPQRKELTSWHYTMN